jgi:hypothetical protein
MPRQQKACSRAICFPAQEAAMGQFTFVEFIAMAASVAIVGLAVIIPTDMVVQVPHALVGYGISPPDRVDPAAASKASEFPKVLDVKS